MDSRAVLLSAPDVPRPNGITVRIEVASHVQRYQLTRQRECRRPQSAALVGPTSVVPLTSGSVADDA